MYCMKCGRDTTEEHIFCDSCLEIMDRYPVRSDVAISLPHRDTDQAFRRPSRKRSLSPEEQVVHLRKSLRRIKAFAAIVFLLLGLAGALLFQSHMRYKHAIEQATLQTETT